MPVPTHKFEWESAAEPADAPPSTWKSLGLAAGRLPAAMINWALKGLTGIWDDWLQGIGAVHGQEVVSAVPVVAGAVWEIASNSADNRGLARQIAVQSLNANSVATYELPLPRGAKSLLGVKVWIKPASGHTAVPSTMPKFVLVQRSVSDFTELANEEVVDDVATPSSADPGQIADYEAHHAIGVDGLDLVLDPEGSRVYLHVFGETGAGDAFQAGLVVRHIEAGFTRELETEYAGTIIPP